MAISQPPFQSTLVDANDRVQTPWAQWFSQLQPILQSIVASGPTSGRPTQNLYIGYPYFDTTIDQMVYWNGVIWVTYAPSTTGTSILKGNGLGGFNNAVAGVDFAPATSGNAILYGDGAGGFSSVSIGSGVTFAGGVLSAIGAGGTVTAVTGSGNIASSGGNTPDITFTGTLPIANGGTNGTATPTAGAVAVGNGTQYAFTAAGSAGQVLTSNGSTVPTWATVATGIGTTGYWGSFWDTTNQTAASTTVAYTINIGTSDPNNNGVSIVSSNQITVAHAGVYNIQYSIQFQNIGTGNKNYNTDVWFRLNGLDIPDSNSTYWIASKNSIINGEMIAAVNYVLSLNAGDYIQLMWAVSDVDISIVTLPASSSPTVPRTPGVIVTVTPITEVGIGYYNLTSVSSVAIATGSKTFTTNLSNISTAFTVGTRVRVAYVTTPANFMEGVITSFSGTTLVVDVDSIGGSGTYASWTISVAGIQGSNGVTSITGTANQVIASASTGAIILSLPQNINSGSAPAFLGTNFTGTASLNINGTVGATTPTTGKFTTLEYTSTLTGGTSIIAIGTNQIYKDASGNLGIGTSATDSKLRIYQSSSTAYGLIAQTPVVGLVAGNTVNMAYFTNSRGAANDGLRIINYRDSTGSGIGNWETESYRLERNVDNAGVQAGIIFGNNELKFTTLSLPRLNIDTSGNVSVGASVPSGTYKLEVSGAISGTTLTSTVATGTAPFTVASATAVANLSIGGNAAGLSTTLIATSGGTGTSTTAIGDLLQGGATNTWVKLSAVATGNALISGGITTASSWGKIGLTTHISGTLAVGNGGTGLTTLTSGYIPYGNGTSALSSSSTLTYNGTSLTAGNFIPSSSTIPTNGLFLAAANTIGIATASTTAIYLDASQNLSMGTFSSQGNKVQVYSDTGVSISPVAGGSYKGAIGVNVLGQNITTGTASLARMYMTGNNSAHAGSLDLRSGTVVGSTFNMFNLAVAQTILIQAVGYSYFNAGGVAVGSTTDPGTGNISAAGTVKTGGYTVATLPTAGTAGRRAHVTNALAPTFGAAVVGGGAVVIPVFDNGTTWIVG